MNNTTSMSTVYKSDPGKSIPLETTTIYFKLSTTTCSNKDATCFPQTRRFDPSWLSSRREPDLLLASSSGKWQQQRNDKTTRQNQLNHVWATRNIYSDPSRTQSNISKTKTENSHECYMNAEIGLSKTQSYESCFTQPHSQSTLLHTLQNSGQIQGNGEWTSSWNESSYSLNHGKSRSVWWMNLELEWHQLFFSPSKFFTADKNQSFQDKILSRFCALNWVTLSDLPGLSAPKQP